MALHCALKLLGLKGEVITRAFALQRRRTYIPEKFRVGFYGSLINRLFSFSCSYARPPHSAILRAVDVSRCDVTVASFEELSKKHVARTKIFFGHRLDINERLKGQSRHGTCGGRI